MNNHITKFVFLAVVVGVIAFSRLNYRAYSENGEAVNSGTGTIADQVPLFVFPTTAVSADHDGTSSPIATATATVPVPIALAPKAAPTVTATAWLVMNLQNNEVIGSSNFDNRWPTASLAKLMAATVVYDKIDFSTQVTITERTFAADPSEVNLAINGRYTVLDLLRAMLLPSSNVAAEAVANFYGRDAFLREMNARAAAWGMANTHYDDPSGISVGDESTVADLAKLAKKIYADYPQLLSIARAPQLTIKELSSGRSFAIKSTNAFAGSSDFLGGKTGYTTEADGNLLSVFRYSGEPVLIIVLGSGGRFNDTQKLYDWYKAQ